MPGQQLTLREERMSAFSLLLPSYTPGVDPGGDLQPERQAATWMYAGIWAAVPSTLLFVVAMVLGSATTATMTGGHEAVSTMSGGQVWPTP